MLPLYFATCSFLFIFFYQCIFLLVYVLCLFLLFCLSYNLYMYLTIFLPLYSSKNLKIIIVLFQYFFRPTCLSVYPAIYNSFFLISICLSIIRFVFPFSLWRNISLLHSIWSFTSLYNCSKFFLWVKLTNSRVVLLFIFIKSTFRSLFKFYKLSDVYFPNSFILARPQTTFLPVHNFPSVSAPMFFYVCITNYAFKWLYPYLHVF